MVFACKNLNRSLFSVAPSVKQLGHALLERPGSELKQRCPCLDLSVLSGDGDCDSA